MTIPTIVTLEQVAAHLNLTVVNDEDDLQLKLDAATEMICKYIADRKPPDPDWVAEIEAWNVDEGSPSNPAPKLVQLAVMELTADFNRFRGDDAGDDRGRQYGWLPLPVVNLLIPYRSPSLS